MLIRFFFLINRISKKDYRTSVAKTSYLSLIFFCYCFCSFLYFFIIAIGGEKHHIFLRIHWKMGKSCLRIWSKKPILLLQYTFLVLCFKIQIQKNFPLPTVILKGRICVLCKYQITPRHGVRLSYDRFHIAPNLLKLSFVKIYHNLILPKLRCGVILTYAAKSNKEFPSVSLTECHPNH